MTISHLNRFHNRSLRKETKLSEVPLDNVFSKLVLVLWMSLSEIEFNILLTENEELTKSFLEKIDLSKKTELDKWITLIDYFFKEQYFGNQNRELTQVDLGDTTFHRYETIKNIVAEDLRPFIELRNRIAHGQWAVAFTSEGIKKNQELTTHIWKLSKKDIMLLKSFVRNLPPLLKLLITSKKTFERDYDKYTNKINKAKKDVDLRFDWLVKYLGNKAKKAAM